MVKKNDFRHGAHFFLLLVHRCTVELDPNTSQSKKFLASNFTSCVSWIWVAFLGKRNVLQLQNSHGSQMNNKRRQSILSAARGVLSELLQMNVLWWWIMGKMCFWATTTSFHAWANSGYTTTTNAQTLPAAAPRSKPDTNEGSLETFCVSGDFVGKKYACSCWVCLHFNLIMTSFELWATSRPSKNI